MTTKPDKASFEQQVRKAFEFLETRKIAAFRNCQMVDDDPRDAYAGCTFENEHARITVAYSWFEIVVGVSIYLKRDNLPRHSRNIDLEPWIEFATEGSTQPLVPFFYPASSKFKPVMDERKRLFETEGLPRVLSSLASKLGEHYDDLIEVTNDEVSRYQEWFQIHP